MAGTTPLGVEGAIPVRRRMLFILGAIAPCLIAADATEPIDALVKAGQQFYAVEQWSPAQEKFEEALKQRPDSRILHFDLGTVLFRLGDFEGALTQFQGALGDTDDQFASKVYFNIGNCQYRLKREQLALEAYRKAAKLDPSDRDARVNLELVAQSLAKGQVSQRARDAYAEAQKLVSKRLYRQALDTLAPVLQEEPAASKRYGKFARRLQQIADIAPAVAEAKI